MDKSHSSAAVAETPESLLAELDVALRGLEQLPQLDDGHYLATHTLFEGLSDQRECITDELCERIDPRRSVGRPLRVLGVGCGAGEVDLSLARSLVAEGDELVYVGVDPNSAQCAAFEEFFAGAELPGVELEIEVATFDEFESPHDFDVIHFVHSLYYMPDPAAALARARRMLAPGGQLVFVQAPREELNELAVRFYDKSYERATLFADDLSEILAGWDWSVERTRLDARVDVTAFVEDEPEVGAALRDFIVQVDGGRLPADVQDLIERYLRLVAFQREGRSLIAHPVDAFFISE